MITLPVIEIVDTVPVLKIIGTGPVIKIIGTVSLLKIIGTVPVFNLLVRYKCELSQFRFKIKTGPTLEIARQNYDKSGPGFKYITITITTVRIRNHKENAG